VKAVIIEGKPCVKCGSTTRYASTGTCVKCKRISDERYRALSRVPGRPSLPPLRAIGPMLTDAPPLLSKGFTRCELCTSPPAPGDILCNLCKRSFGRNQPAAEYREPDVTAVLRVLAELRVTT
jgi:hypothetical protein